MNKKAVFLVLVSILLLSFASEIAFAETRIHAADSGKSGQGGLSGYEQSDGADRWPMFHHDLTHTGYSTSTGPHTNQTLWSYTTGDWVPSSPAVAGGRVYVGSYDEKVYALNAYTGAFIWSYTTSGQVFSSPAVAYGRVYVGSNDGIVYALNAYTGAFIWSYTTGDIVYSSPAVADGKVYAGSCDGKIYAFDASTGTLVWSYTTGGRVSYSSPAVVGGRVYIGSEDYRIYCLDASTGTLVWNYTTNGFVFSAPAVADGRVYVCEYNGGIVYALNASTGAYIWSYTTDERVFFSPAVADGKVYVGSYGNKFYCLNASTGAYIWSYTTGGWLNSSPALADGKVYVGSDDTKVYALNASTGAFIWSYTTGDRVFSSPAVADGRVYVGSIDGKIYAFGARAPWGDWSHYHDYAEIVDTLLYLNGTYPNNVDVFSIGKSWLNQDIYCIKLTNESNANPKPKLLFIGYHHAREPISAELALYFAVEAVTNFGTDETITRLLNCSEIYVIPALNVDGFQAAKQNEWNRKNLHPFDEDYDTLLDEDPPEDVDGDGYIEDLIRWTGSEWVFVRWEGTDTDSDGLLNEDWIGGVDLNRNYGYQWDAECYSGSPYPWAEDFRGPAPFSEPETQAIRDFALANDFRYAVSFHSGAEIIGYPWGYTTDPPPDDAIFREVAANLSALTGASYGQNSGLYTMSGSLDDWMYANRSTLAFTCEIYTNNSAWQYEPGPDPDTYWERGVFQFFNPDPSQIESVIQRWLPVFTYTTGRAIAETHNIAAINVTTQKTVVGQGYLVNVTVTVKNQGYFTETFNVTVYANTTIIETREMTLTSGSSSTATLSWNTTGFAYGPYTIWAHADQIIGETETEDNSHVDGTVTVVHIGDINADNKINILDIVRVAIAFGSRPSSPNWDPNADINGDNVINILDIAVIAIHFGQVYPFPFFS